MAKFAQMLLNKGKYGSERILSPVTVKQMTINQIPGLSSQYFGEYFPEASWGYGLNIFGNKRDRGSFHSPQAYGHGGGGGVCFWVDPVYSIVGVWFCVETEHLGVKPSLFMNAVTASIEAE